MKLKDAVIYVFGTISVIAIGLIIVGGVALFMTNRIESATSNHTIREAERIAEVGEEPEPSKREIYKDAEFVIENSEYDINRNRGAIEWRTTEGSNGEYQSGEVIYYVRHGNVTIRQDISEFPRYVSYTVKLNEAIEEAVQNEQEAENN